MESRARPACTPPTSRRPLVLSGVGTAGGPPDTGQLVMKSCANTNPAETLGIRLIAY